MDLSPTIAVTAFCLWFPLPSLFTSTGYLQKDRKYFAPCLFGLESFSTEAIGKIPTEENEFYISIIRLSHLTSPFLSLICHWFSGPTSALFHKERCCLHGSNFGATDNEVNYMQASEISCVNRSILPKSWAGNFCYISSLFHYPSGVLMFKLRTR